MATHINMTSVCTSFYGISDHKSILLSCNKVLSDGLRRPAKVSKWTTHICKTKNSDILSLNYFLILANDLDSHYNTLTADEMVDLIKSIPKMHHYSWIKESKTLYKKIKKYKCVKYDNLKWNIIYIYYNLFI